MREMMLHVLLHPLAGSNGVVNFAHVAASEAGEIRPINYFTDYCCFHLRLFVYVSQSVCLCVCPPKTEQPLIRH